MLVLASLLGYEYDTTNNAYSMSKFAAFIFIILSSFLVKGQNTWSDAMLEKAKTASNANYLSPKEKEVIYYLNLVRMNPSLFGKTYLKDYLETEQLNSRYTKSLIKTLKSAKPAPLLTPTKDLHQFAKKHALKYGKRGKTGHGNFTTRTKNIKEKYGSAIAENCDYGNDSPLAIVMSLLIDEENPSYGHRKNILNPNYYFVGTSIQAHKKYTWNCVMDFGGKKK